jgi:hypothetical protein
MEHDIPYLKPIDITLANKYECPGIEIGKLYLVKKNGCYVLGVFNRQWYGLNFQPASCGCGFQFDAPGQNASKWEAIWELVGAVDNPPPPPPARSPNEFDDDDDYESGWDK